MTYPLYPTHASAQTDLAVGEEVVVHLDALLPYLSDTSQSAAMLGAQGLRNQRGNRVICIVENVAKYVLVAHPLLNETMAVPVNYVERLDGPSLHPEPAR